MRISDWSSDVCSSDLASAALGRVVAIYLHADAVRLLDPGLNWAEDVRFAAVGSPAIAELLGSAMELGVRITACQTGLALTGLPADALPQGVAPGGLVDFLGRAQTGRAWCRERGGQ